MIQDSLLGIVFGSCRLPRQYSVNRYYFLVIISRFYKGQGHMEEKHELRGVDVPRITQNSCTQLREGSRA